MKQLTFVGAGRLAWEDVPAPCLEGPGEALVRPLAVATCDLDGPMLSGRAPVEGPFPFGHEGVAEVVEVGADVTGVRPGDRVIVPFQISCGDCRFCARGLTASCASVPRLASYGLGPFGGRQVWGGFLSDLVRVPFAEAMLVPLPQAIDAASAASASDNIPDGWRAVAPPLAARPGAPVLVLAGGGSIPLYAAAIARALGAERVDYVDTSPDRLALAGRLGANPLEGPPPRRIGPYPIVVNATNDPDWLLTALRSTEPGGICTSVSIFWGESTPLPLFDMYSRGTITFVTGRVNARAAIPPVLELIAGGRFHPEQVTTRVVPWDQAPAALLAGDWTKLVIARD